MTKKNPKVEQRKEIIYNIINSLLAGFLVFLGSFINGGFSWEAICVSAVASLIISISQFKKYWESQAGEYSTIKIGAFI